MILGLALAVLAYLAVGAVVWLVTCLAFAGKTTNGYLATLYAAAKSSVFLEAAVASGVVLLWPAHLLIAYAVKR